jgi:poly(A) polymerase
MTLGNFDLNGQMKRAKNMSFQLKSLLKIDLPDGVDTQALRDVMTCLNNDGDVLTLLVGGCVRNAIIGGAATDIDLATKLTPDQVMERCRAAGMKAIPTGIDHGTVTIVHDGLSVEVTTLRKDVETDGRRAVVAFSQDWAEDARRRDFTMNTLLMDLNGHVYDPTGQGVRDLQARRVVFVGDPVTRIAEDILRILRFFRFHGAYGVGEPDGDALKACRDAADQIQTLSRERVSQEFFKITMLGHASSVLELMFNNSVLKDFFEKENSIQDFTLLANLQVKYQDCALAGRLYALFGDGYLQYEDKLVFSNSLKAQLKVFSENNDAVLNSDHDVQVLMYRVGRDLALQIVFLNAYRVDDMDHAVTLMRNWGVPKFPVTGDDLIAEGYERGPDLGVELKSRENAWIARGFK